VYTGEIPENCEADLGQELRKNKELEQMERLRNRDVFSARTLKFILIEGFSS